MGLIKAVKKFLLDPTPTSTIAALEPGRAAAEGVVRKGDEGTMTSPVKGQACVAFFYRAAYVVVSRAGQMLRPLRSEEAFHPFTLQLDDGSLVAVPRKAGGFSAADHRKLGSSGYLGFRALEEVIPLGARVRIHGVARQVDGQWTLTYRKIEKVDAPPARPSTAPTRKKARRNKK